MPRSPPPTWLPPTIPSSTAASWPKRPFARAAQRIRASPSGSRSSRACSSPTSSCWARSTKAPGRKPPIRAPGSTGRCAQRSGCRRRRSASAMRRTSSPRCSAWSASISRARPRSTACRRCRRAGCCGCRPCSKASARPRRRISPGSPGRTPAMRSMGRRARCARRSRARRVAMRPRQLSVTTIEKWIANPYAIFAERILELAPLPALGQRARCRPARPDRARGAEPVRARIPTSCRTTSMPSCMEFAEARAGRLAPARRAWRRSGRRGSRASPPGSPRPSAPVAPASTGASPRSRARWCWAAPPAPSRSRRAPIASMPARPASSSPTTRRRPVSPP